MTTIASSFHNTIVEPCFRKPVPGTIVSHTNAKGRPWNLFQWAALANRAGAGELSRR